MTDPWLSPRQVERLTGKVRPTAQARVLDEARIPYRMVAGRPVVLKEHAGPSITSSSRPKLVLT